MLINQLSWIHCIKLPLVVKAEWTTPMYNNRDMFSKQVHIRKLRWYISLQVIILFSFQTRSMNDRISCASTKMTLFPSHDFKLRHSIKRCLYQGYAAIRGWVKLNLFSDQLFCATACRAYFACLLTFDAFKLPYSFFYRLTALLMNFPIGTKGNEFMNVPFEGVHFNIASIVILLFRLRANTWE